MTIEQRVDATVEQSQAIRQQLFEDLAALEAAFQKVRETAAKLPPDGETHTHTPVYPRRRRLSWFKLAK